MEAEGGREGGSDEAHRLSLAAALAAARRLRRRRRRRLLLLLVPPPPAPASCMRLCLFFVSVVAIRVHLPVLRRDLTSILLVEDMVEGF